MARFRRTALLVALTTVLVGYAMQAAAQTEEPYAPVIDPASFTDVIDNPYFPLTPGTIFIYASDTENGTEITETSVLPETKEILSIPCTVVRDILKLDGEVIEDTFDWYAQDTDGNV